MKTLKRKPSALLALLLFASLAVNIVQAQLSSANSISFQGALTGTNGQPLPNGPYNLTFRFYDVPTNGTALATSTVPNVTITGGIASTPIPVDAAWFDGETRFLGIAVNNGQELAPRVLITTVPYATYSQATRGMTVKPNGSVTIGPSVASDTLTVIAETGRQALVLANTNTSVRPFQFLMDGWDPVSGAIRFGFFLPYNHAAGHQSGPDAAIYWDGAALSLGSPNDGRPVFKVGIGTKIPQTQLDVDGTARMTVCQITSDRAAEDKFTLICARDVLTKLAALPISTWEYTNASNIRHIGPVAQDFHAAFSVGEDNKHIATVDADGVALAAIQGLFQLVQEKDAKIQNLEKRLEALERKLEARFAANERP